MDDVARAALARQRMVDEHAEGLEARHGGSLWGFAAKAEETGAASGGAAGGGGPPPPPGARGAPTVALAQEKKASAAAAKADREQLALVRARRAEEAAVDRAAALGAAAAAAAAGGVVAEHGELEFHPLFNSDVALNALLMLDTDSLCHALRVCRVWSSFASSEHIFRHLCNSIYPVQARRAGGASAAPRAAMAQLTAVQRQRYGSWRGMFLARPRVRTSGLYLTRFAAIKEVCRMMQHGNDLAFDHVNETVIYRYLRFGDNGKLHYLTHSGYELPPTKASRLFAEVIAQEAGDRVLQDTGERLHSASESNNNSGGGGTAGATAVAAIGSGGAAAAHALSHGRRRRARAELTDRAKPEAKIVGGVFSVDQKGNVLAQVNEHHAMIQFRLRVKSTAGPGSNDHLEWLGHALMA